MEQRVDVSESGFARCKGCKNLITMDLSKLEFPDSVVCADCSTRTFVKEKKQTTYWNKLEEQLRHI